VRIKRRFRARIPRGVEHGTFIQLAGEGEVGPCGGPPADLYLEVVELADPRFERRGDDLYASATITKSLAKSGGTFNFDLLSGPAKVVVPAGQVETGVAISLDGEGAYHLVVDDEVEESSAVSGRGTMFIKMTVIE
jgi:molecular chaperone DnaJ